jgi:hypothetical protein
MEEDRNLEQNLDKGNEKLHISDVMYSMTQGQRINSFIDIGIMVNVFRPLTYINGDFYDDYGKLIPISMITDWEYCT